MSAELSAYQEDMSRRLRRIEGQIRGIQKMVEEERTAEAILQQLTAVSSAIHGAGLRILVEFYSTSLSETADIKSYERERRTRDFSALLDRVP